MAKLFLGRRMSLEVCEKAGKRMKKICDSVTSSGDIQQCTIAVLFLEAVQTTRSTTIPPTLVITMKIFFWVNSCQCQNDFVCEYSHE